MNRTKLIQLYLNSITATAKALVDIICSTDKADTVYAVTLILLTTEQETEFDIAEQGIDSEEPELTKICRTILMQSISSVIEHLEKFQLQNYHFEALIHSLELDRNTLSEEIRLA